MMDFDLLLTTEQLIFLKAYPSSGVKASVHTACRNGSPLSTRAAHCSAGKASHWEKRPPFLAWKQAHSAQTATGAVL
jgi:hypothetical protein